MALFNAAGVDYGRRTVSPCGLLQALGEYDQSSRHTAFIDVYTIEQHTSNIVCPLIDLSAPVVSGRLRQVNRAVRRVG